MRLVRAFLVLALLPVTADAQEPSAAQMERVATVRKKLQNAFKEGAVRGRFFERNAGDYVFSPKASDLPQVAVKNAASVTAFAVGPLLDVRGSMSDKGVLTVSTYELVPPPVTAVPAKYAQDLNRATSGIIEALTKTVQPGAMNTTNRTLSGDDALTTQTKTSIADYLKVYREALESGADEKTLRPIVERWANLRLSITETFTDSEDYKAMYGPLDNYDPWRYDLIFRQSSAVVAIGEPGASTARCSGVLIADNLVLTAAHCFAGSKPMEPKSLQVWFNYARKSTASIMRRPIKEAVSPPPERLPQVLDGVFDANFLDYAVVRFDAPGGEPLKPAEALPQCIRRGPVHKGEPVYVIGYPKGAPIMVHDSARVYLPYFTYDGKAFYRLRIDTEADLLDSPQRAEFMAEFDASYVTGKHGGVPSRFLHHVKDGGQPRIGIIADTFQGNSGGPVYDRERAQCIIGVFIAGAQDTGVRRTASWKDHERVLPITAVLADLQKTSPATLKRLIYEKEDQ